MLQNQTDLVQNLSLPRMGPPTNLNFLIYKMGATLSSSLDCCEDKMRGRRESIRWKAIAIIVLQLMQLAVFCKQPLNFLCRKKSLPRFSACTVIWTFQNTKIQKQLGRLTWSCQNILHKLAVTKTHQQIYQYCYFIKSI